MSRTSTDDAVVMYADYVCPFCYLGKESLAQYRNEREEPLDVEWHPFDLRGHKRGPSGEIDESVEDGKDDAYYEQAKENVRRLQEEYGVEMDLDIATDIDSWNAQQASLYVRREQPEAFADFHEAVYDALWTESEDIGDPDVLASIAEEVGVDPDGVREAIENDELEAELAESFESAQRTGVTGVPTFAYNGHAARGAVPPSQLQRLVDGVGN